MKCPFCKANDLTPVTRDGKVVGDACTACGWLTESLWYKVPLWVVGKVLEQSYGDIPKTAWEFVGIYDSERKAVDACITDHYFVAPVCLNETAPLERVVWPGCYYPLAEKRSWDQES